MVPNQELANHKKAEGRHAFSGFFLRPFSPPPPPPLLACVWCWADILIILNSLWGFCEAIQWERAATRPILNPGPLGKQPACPSAGPTAKGFASRRFCLSPLGQTALCLALSGILRLKASAALLDKGNTGGEPFWGRPKQHLARLLTHPGGKGGKRPSHTRGGRAEGGF